MIGTSGERERDRETERERESWKSVLSGIFDDDTENLSQGKEGFKLAMIQLNEAFLAMS